MRLVVAGPEAADGHRLAGHPERPDRVRTAMAGIEALDLGSDVLRLAERDATKTELARVHTSSYLQRLESSCEGGSGLLDPDTFVTADSWACALRSAGAGLAAIEALTRGQGDLAFVAARPPGHHALSDRAMGFCLLNNVAVAAAALADRGERVTVVDWDVHHGNGTQAIFWDDHRVLYVSTHQAPFYPGTGAVAEAGGPDAAGLTVNIPLPAGATGDVVRSAMEQVAAPVVERFKPTWVLVSAGFDAHRADPLGDLELSAGDFGAIATVVAGFAPQPGRLALFLEGGYDRQALQASVAATLGSLLDARQPSEAPTAGGPGADAVERARLLHVEEKRHQLW